MRSDSKLVRFTPFINIKAASSTTGHRYLKSEFGSTLTLSYFSEEDASNRLKEYWTDVLTQALAALDDIPYYEGGMSIGHINRLAEIINPSTSVKNTEKTEEE